MGQILTSFRWGPGPPGGPGCATGFRVRDSVRVMARVRVRLWSWFDRRPGTGSCHLPVR